MSTQTWSNATGPVVEPPSPRTRTGSALPSNRHRDVASLVAQIARAARSFPLYDSSNDAVRRSLASLCRAFASVLAEAPRLALVIRPFEILFEGRRVYVDRDCERSLAFRLYVDRVRGLVFHAGLGATEVERLIHVLSTRFAGLERDEEDVVTLLWKARLQSLEVVALEPAQDPMQDVDGAGGRRRPQLPDEVDPLPGVGAEPPLERHPIEQRLVERLRGEVAPGRLADEGVLLLTRLTAALEDPGEQMRFSELRSLCEEIREALLSVERLPALLRFVRGLQKLAWSTVEWDAERHQAVLSVILSCGSDRAVRKLVHSVPAAMHRLPPELVELLDIVCPDPMTAVAEALAVETNAAGRAIARQLLEHYGRRQAASLRRRFQEARGQVAADFLRSLVRVESGAPADFLARQCAHSDPEVRAEALWHVERTAFTSALGHTVAEALRRTEGGDRLRLLGIVERSRDRRFVPSLLRLLETDGLPAAEALDIARVVGRLEGQQGLDRWRRQLTPKGPFFKRRLPGSAAQQMAAATAVAQVPGEEASHLLRRACPAAEREARPIFEQLLQQRGPVAPGRRAS